MCVAHGLGTGKAYILDAGCRICKHPPPPFFSAHLREAKKNINDPAVSSGGSENVVKEEEMCEAA